MRESLCYSCIHNVKGEDLDGFRTCNVKDETKTPVTNIDPACKFYDMISFYDKYCWKCKHINPEESRQCLMGFYGSNYESVQENLSNIVKEYNKGNTSITCPYFKPQVIIMKNKEGYNGS